MNSLKDLLEFTLQEIDRQIKASETFTPEQALIWIFAGERAREALTRLYPKNQEPDPRA